MPISYGSLALMRPLRTGDLLMDCLRVEAKILGRVDGEEIGKCFMVN